MEEPWGRDGGGVAEGFVKIVRSNGMACFPAGKGRNWRGGVAASGRQVFRTLVLSVPWHLAPASPAPPPPSTDYFIHVISIPHVKEDGAGCC
jgi:hypothetical protein